MTQRPLLPRFLNKLDNYLLVHSPATWTARTHLALWYSLLFDFLLAVLCFLVPFDAREGTSVYYWVVFVSIIIALGFIFWLIYLLRFNVFKRYGNLPAAYGLKTFFLYAVAIGAMITSAYIPAVVESIRANKAYTNEEIVRDINMINIDLCRLERDSITLNWARTINVLRRDTATDDNNDVDVEAKAEETTIDRDQVDEVARPDYPGNNSYIYPISKAYLKKKIAAADSVIKINDSTWHFFECPGYNFVRAYYNDEYSKVKILSSVALYNKVLKHYTPPDRKKALKEVDSLKAKYNSNRYYSVPYEFPPDYHFIRSDYRSHLSEKYGLYPVGRSMTNIDEKKYRWKGNTIENSIRMFYYLVLIFTLLVFIFRHTTTKTFFLSLLTGIILVILTAMTFAFMRNDRSSSVLMVIALYFWLFAIIAFTIRLDKTRRAWKGISLNLALGMLPFMPVLAVELYYSFLEAVYPSYQFPEKYINHNLHFLLAEIAGFVLLVVLLDTVIKPLYRKWYSLPEQ